MRTLPANAVAFLMATVFVVPLVGAIDGPDGLPEPPVLPQLPGPQEPTSDPVDDTAAEAQRREQELKKEVDGVKDEVGPMAPEAPARDIPGLVHDTLWFLRSLLPQLPTLPDDAIQPQELPLVPDKDPFPSGEDDADAPAPVATLSGEVHDTGAPLGGEEAALAGAAVAAGMALTAAGSKAFAMTRVVAAALAPLFSRFHGPNVLDHPRRAELHTMVCREPGITIPELSRATRLSRNTVIHHLKMLQNQGMVVQQWMGRTTHWFENGGRYGREHKEAYAVLQDERSRQVADLIRSHPGATQQELGQRLGLAPSVIHWHVRRLEQASLVDRQRAGHAMQCFPTSVLPGLDL